MAPEDAAAVASRGRKRAATEANASHEVHMDSIASSAGPLLALLLLHTSLSCVRSLGEHAWLAPMVPICFVIKVVVATAVVLEAAASMDLKRVLAVTKAVSTAAEETASSSNVANDRVRRDSKGQAK
jgi:hypothetical protein